MRPGVTIALTAVDRRRLGAIIGNRNVPQKHAWRAEIVLLTADGLGTVEILRRTGKSKTCVWAAEGVDGLLRDKTRPPRVPPLGQEVIDQVVALTASCPGSGRSSASMSTPRRMPWCCRSMRSRMCGWPPACKRKVDGCERRACGHVSGLFARRTRPLATMDVRGLGPHQILGFEALDFFRLTQPVGTTDTSISFSLLQALAGRSHGFVRPQQPADSILLLSSPPRRSARSCWPVLPPPSAVRSVPTGPGSTDWLWPPSSAAEPFGRRRSAVVEDTDRPCG